MHFSEEDLRAALKRKDPGEDFTRRVMAQVNQNQANQAQAEAARLAARKRIWALPSWWTRHPAWAAAIAALLLFAFALAGFEYSEYRHREDLRIAQENQQRLQEAERARDEAIRALEIARSKLNHVLERAQLPVAFNDKIRRQRL